MTNSAIDKTCREFRYSETEMTVIRKSLGDPMPDNGNYNPNWIKVDLIFLDNQDRWAFAPNRLHNYVHLFAIQSLEAKYNSSRKTDLHERLDNIDKIAKAAATLVSLLGKEARPYPSYAEALGVDGIIERKKPHKYAFPEYPILSELQKIADADAQMKAKFKKLLNPNPARINGHLHEFVGALCSYWVWWKRENPGGSKGGGPSAQFICNCIGPVESYANKKLGGKYRRVVSDKHRRESGGEISAEWAGSLINQVRKLYKI